MTRKKASDSVRMRRVARETLEQINALPEWQGRRVVKFLALVYLRPQDCRFIERVLVPSAEESKT